MPRLTEVEDLSSHITRIVSTNIQKNLEQHIVAADCEFCSKRLPEPEECQYVLPLKHLLNETPIHTVQMLNEKIMSAISYWYYQYKNANNTKMRYLVAFIFEVVKFQFSSTIKEEEDLQFIQKFGDHIQVLTFEELNFLPQFLSALQYMTSLQIIIFNNEIQITEIMFSTIGKYCNCLRTLGGSMEVSTYCSLLEKLIFQDPQTQKIRNKCCSTLEYVGRARKMLSQNWYEEWNAEVKKCEIMLLKNLPNLKSTDLDALLEMSESKLDVRNKIEKVHFEELTMGQFEKLKQICVNLQYLSVSESNIHDVRVLDLLHTLSSIQNLELHDIHTSLYKNIFASKWSNLKNLKFMNDDDEAQDLELNVLADNLEKLEKLFTWTFRRILWNRKSTFKALKTIDITVILDESDDLVWFRSFSDTITYICCNIRGIRYVHPDQISTFTADYYPKLEHISIGTIVFDSQFVKNVVMKCPRLHIFEIFKTEGSILFEECSDYFKERNIDCTVYRNQ